MRVLSVRQPWASLIASGKKRVELRSWWTAYRGPVLIVSGTTPWRGEHGFELGPRGVSICLVDLADCLEYDDTRDRKRSCLPDHIDLNDGKQWYSFVLERPRAVRSVPVKGKLGLYKADAALERIAATAVRPR
jgi:hypothetical protein